MDSHVPVVRTTVVYTRESCLRVPRRHKRHTSQIYSVFCFVKLHSVRPTRQLSTELQHECYASVYNNDCQLPFFDKRVTYIRIRLAAATLKFRTTPTGGTTN